MKTTEALSDMEITGNVDGDIAGKNINITKSGSVHGNLGADSVVISGIVTGIVEAQNIEILATAHVKGELRYDSLSVNRGARMEAKCVPIAA